MPGQSKQEEIIMTPDVRVRIMTLEPEDEIKWHHHTNVTDNAFCLEGAIDIRLREPDETVTLTPGERHEVKPGRAHAVVNIGSYTSRYLLVQGVGAYDFVPS